MEPTLLFWEKTNRSIGLFTDEQEMETIMKVELGGTFILVPVSQIENWDQIKTKSSVHYDQIKWKAWTWVEEKQR